MAKVDKKYFISFLNRLSTLLEAGIPLLPSIQILQENKKSKHHHLIRTIEDELKQGKMLSSIIEENASAYKETITLIRIAEENGRLDFALKQSAKYLEKREEMKKKIVSSLIYPAIVILSTLAVLFFLINNIIPSFNSMFQEFGIRPPLITRLIIWGSDFMSLNRYSIFFSILFVLLLLAKGQQLTIIKKLKTKLKWKLPYISSLVKAYYCQKIFFCLGTLTISGVNMISALTICEDVADDLFLKNKINQIIKDIKGGEKIFTAFEQSRIFPQEAIIFIKVGEASGNLDKVFLSYSEIEENQLELLTKRLSQLIEPCATIAVGIAVAIIVFSVFVPMLKVMESLPV